MMRLGCALCCTAFRRRPKRPFVDDLILSRAGTPVNEVEPIRLFADSLPR
jgi:hypothetical protein